MGIQFSLIAHQFSRAAEAVSDTYPRGRYTGDRVFRRLIHSVRSLEPVRGGQDPEAAWAGQRGSCDSIPTVIANVQRAVPPHSMDVLRIVCHGGTGRNPTLLLGTGLTVETAEGFERIRPLWSQVYVPRRRDPLLQTSEPNYHTFMPRIEMHVCNAALHSGAILQALARAARAPVFGSRIVQATENLEFEYLPPEPSPPMHSPLVRYDPLAPIPAAEAGGVSQ